MHEFYQLSRKELMLLIKDVLEEKEQQNQHIRQFINDTSINLSIAIQLNLSILEEELNLTPSQLDALTSAIVCSQSLSAELLGLTNNIQPIELQTVGLYAAILQLCEQVKQVAPFPLDCKIEDITFDNKKEMADVAIYRLTDQFLAYLLSRENIERVNLSLYEEKEQVVWNLKLFFKEKGTILDFAQNGRQSKSKAETMLQALLIWIEQLGFDISISIKPEESVWHIRIKDA